MQRPGRKCFGAFLALALVWIVISGITLRLTKGGGSKQEQAENAEWIATSKSWLNRFVCSWFGLCGVPHLLDRDGWTWHTAEESIPHPEPDTNSWWLMGPGDPLSWSGQEKAAREIPQYVFDHAPYVHLFSEEQFWPCDIAEHLVHTPPSVNYTKITDLSYDRNLSNLNELNNYDGGAFGRFLYLQSSDNVENRPRPRWLSGADNIPDAPKRITLQNHDGDDSWPDEQDVLEPSQPDRPPEEEPNFHVETTEDLLDYLAPLKPSTNGQCGGGTGFTCKGSKFGECCSIYGWCGTGDSYCGDSCDAVAGLCNDPFEPVPLPHSDLRKRTLHLGGAKNRPSPIGRSSAPALLIVVPKENGIVDAFWFFFYSFNLGQKVFNVRFGNHVGDWEHTLIRFKHGKPDTVFLSEHNFGDAYSYHALEKYIPNPDDPSRMLGTWSNGTATKHAKRPVVYSAVGTHAMYATPGQHPYILPWGLLHDQTDRGPLWDPALNVRAYTWELSTKTLRAATNNPLAPTEWFHYAGHWGDKFYPLSDPRQYRFAGQYHYVNGPVGPRFKRLDRKKVCQAAKKECHIRQWLSDGRATRPMPEEYVEEGGLPGGNYTDDLFY